MARAKSEASGVMWQHLGALNAPAHISVWHAQCGNLSSADNLSVCISRAGMAAGNQPNGK